METTTITAMTVTTMSTKGIVIQVGDTATKAMEREDIVVVTVATDVVTKRDVFTRYHTEAVMLR